MCFNIFGGGGGGAARQSEKIAQQQADQAQADAAAKAEKLRTGMANIDNAFAPFDDTYFAGLAKNYTDYAMPQLQDQYDQAKKDITFALARKGNLNSTTAGDQYALLDRENALNTTNIYSTAQDYANQARSDVASNKSAVQSQLGSTYDADAANSDALERARVLTAPKGFSPLGQMFTNISALAAQSKLASDANPYNATYGAKSYNTGSNSYSVGA